MNIHAFICVHLRMNNPGFDGHAEVESELEQEFKEDVLLGAVYFQVPGVRLQAGGEVGAVRVPRLDVAAIQLEDAEAEVAGGQRVLLSNLPCLSGCHTHPLPVVC